MKTNPHKNSGLNFLSYQNLHFWPLKVLRQASENPRGRSIVHAAITDHSWIGPAFNTLSSQGWDKVRHTHWHCLHWSTVENLNVVKKSLVFKVHGHDFSPKLASHSPFLDHASGRTHPVQALGSAWESPQFLQESVSFLLPPPAT